MGPLKWFYLPTAAGSFYTKFGWIGYLDVLNSEYYSTHCIQDDGPIIYEYRLQHCAELFARIAS